MGTSKHRTDTSLKIQEYIETQPLWSKKICDKLRELILTQDKEIHEGYNWGPNYFLPEGMICGFSAHKKHVSFTFFQGTLLRDKHNILLNHATNPHNKSLHFEDVREIKEEILREYLAEAIDNCRKGIKVLQADNNSLSLAPDIQREFRENGILNYFNSLPYSLRREYLDWIATSKKDETRKNRIEKAIDMISKKEVPTGAN